jgi:hypothetical protein
MKSKSYFVDRIIKLRKGEGDKDELMKLQMVDILQILNEERAKNKKPETDDIVEMIPEEKDDDDEEPEIDEEKKEEIEEEESDSDEESMVSIVKRFLFTPKGE